MKTENKITLSLIVFFGLLLFQSCDILEQMGEVQRFVQCDFSISDAQLVNIAGVDITKINNKQKKQRMKMII